MGRESYMVNDQIHRRIGRPLPTKVDLSNGISDP